jgi:sugar O-acyltransferase (sialic acid O-acetyltransferase NeuD family)
MRSIIIGFGDYGAVYLTYLQEVGVNVIGFVDDNHSLIGKEIEGVEVIGTIDDLKKLKIKYQIEAVYCPIGNNKLRVNILKNCQLMGLITPNFIHSSVFISPHVKIGNGVYILPSSNIMPFAVINNFVMISMGVNIAHHSELKEGVFLSTGVNFGASITAMANAYVGISATIMTGVKTLGENCLIGAGAVVIRDVPDFTTVVGNPAKIVSKKYNTFK